MEEKQQGAVGSKRGRCVVRQFPATVPSKAREYLGAGRHIVLFGKPKGVRRALNTPRFTIKLYDTEDAEIVETLMEEQPYRHYLGYFTKAISTDDLREEVNDLIWSRYKVAL